MEFAHSSCVYTDLAYQWASVLSFASECKDVTCLVQAILVIHNLRFEAPLVEQISEVCSDRKSIAERLLWEGFLFFSVVIVIAKIAQNCQVLSSAVILT